MAGKKEPDDYEPFKDFDNLWWLPNTLNLLQTMDDGLTLVNLMAMHYERGFEIDEEKFWSLPLTLHCVLNDLVEIDKSNKKEEQKETVKQFYQCMINTYKISKKLESSLKITDFAAKIDDILLEHREQLHLTESVEENRRIKGIAKLNKVTLSIYLEIRRKYLESNGLTKRIMNSKNTEKISAVLNLFLQNVHKMPLRAAYNICEDFFKFMDEYPKMKTVKEFVESHSVMVMKQLLLITRTSPTKDLNYVLKDEIEPYPEKKAIFLLVKQLTADYCYSRKVYETIAKCEKLQNHSEGLQMKKAFFECCFSFGVPPDKVTELVKNKDFEDSLTDAGLMKTYIQSWMSLINFDKQNQNMLDAMDTQLSNSTKEIQKKILGWINDLEESHKNSVKKLLTQELKELTELEVKNIVDGDLGMLWKKLPLNTTNLEKLKKLCQGKIQNLKKKELGALFNEVASIPDGVLKRLLQGVLKNLITFSPEAKNTLELQVKCKLCLFLLKTKEILTEVPTQEGSEELLILFAACLMQKTMDKRKSENHSRSDYYVHYVTRDPEAICDKYRDFFVNNFGKNSYAFFSDKKHGGKVLKICNDIDFGTKRRVNRLHILLLDESFFTERDLITYLWKVWYAFMENGSQENMPDIPENWIEMLENMKQLNVKRPLLRSDWSDFLKNLPEEQKEWLENTVFPICQAFTNNRLETRPYIERYTRNYDAKLVAASDSQDTSHYLPDATKNERKDEFPAVFVKADGEFQVQLKDRIKSAERICKKVAVIFPDKDTMSELEKQHYEEVERNITTDNELQDSSKYAFRYGFPSPSNCLEGCHVIQTFPFERSKLMQTNLSSFNYIINISRLKNSVSKNCMENFNGSSEYNRACLESTSIQKMQIDLLLLIEFPQSQALEENDALAMFSVNAQETVSDEGSALFYGFFAKHHYFLVKHVLPFKKDLTFENISDRLQNVLKIRKDSKMRFDEGERPEGIVLINQADFLKCWKRVFRTEPPFNAAFIRCNLFDVIVNTKETDVNKFIQRARVLEDVVLEVHMNSGMLHHFQQVVSVSKVHYLKMGNTLANDLSKYSTPIVIECKPPKSTLPSVQKFFELQPDVTRGNIDGLSIACQRCIALIEQKKPGTTDFIAEVMENSIPSYYSVSANEKTCEDFVSWAVAVVKKLDEYKKIPEPEPKMLIKIVQVCYGLQLRATTGNKEIYFYGIRLTKDDEWSDHYLDSRHYVEMHSDLYNLFFHEDYNSSNNVAISIYITDITD